MLATLWAPRTGTRDPRLRLLALVLAALLLIGLGARGAVLFAAACIVAALALGGPGRGNFLRVAAVLSGITLLLNAFTAPGPPLWSWGPIQLTAAGMAAGVGRAVRLVGLAALARIMARVIGAGEVADLARRLVYPLERVVTPLCGLGLALALAVRFAPEMGTEAARIRMAQAARPPQRGAPRRGARLRALEPFFLPLLAGTVRRADEVARTLDARGYASGAPSRRSEDRLGPAGWAAAAALAAAAGLLLVAGRSLGRGG